MVDLFKDWIEKWKTNNPKVREQWDEAQRNVESHQWAKEEWIEKWRTNNPKVGHARQSTYWAG